VLIAFYRAGREAEVARIGRAVVVNGILNGAVARVKEGEEIWLSKGG
jgi:antitoxin (DNA-binding transcriptional repressor) of toxin-antitoxin stability system